MITAFFRINRSLSLLAAAFFGLLPLCIAPVVSAQELEDAEAKQLLERLRVAREKSPGLTADFAEEKSSRLLSKPMVSNGTLTFQSPNKFRREIRGANPSITVSNGKELWIYYPKFQQAERYRIGQRTFFDDAVEALTAGLNFQQVAEFYRYKIFREPTGYRLALTPRSGGLKRIVRELTVWVDADFRIQKTSALLPKGDTVATTYRNQKTANPPASVFDYSLPEGTTVTQPLER